MNAFDQVLTLSPYEPAILALAVLCLAVMLQALLTAPLAFLKEEQAPGLPLKGDHSLLSFRVLRTHANSIENLPVFGFSVVLGIGATAVNWLAGIHVVSRLAFWAIYYSGIGQVAGGPRTLSYIGGALSNLALIVMILYALV